MSSDEIPAEGGDKHWIYFGIVDKNTGKVIATTGARARLVEYIPGHFTFYLDVYVDPTKEANYVDKPTVGGPVTVERPLGTDLFTFSRWPVYPSKTGPGLATWDRTRKIGTAGLGLSLITSDGSNSIAVEQYVDMSYQFPVNG